MNADRLARSLHLLRLLNEARALGIADRITRYDSLLRQHDADARGRTDPRQLSIYDTIYSEEP